MASFGGTYRPNNQPKPKPKKPGNGPGVYDPATGNTFQPPPFMSYDPSIDAEIRANQRGLQDQEQDFTTQRKIDRQDKRQSLHDIQRSFDRGRQDIKTDLHRGMRAIGQKREDIHQTAQRGAEDFGIRLNTMFRKYGIEATNQAQTANARGVGEGGTLAAAQQKRDTNMGIERGALELARSRQQEDIHTALTRLGIDQGELRTDIKRTKKRLGQDTGRETKLTKRDFKRTRREARRGLNRARREAAISEIDLTQQAIYNARQLNPGAFSKYGKKTKGKGGKKK